MIESTDFKSLSKFALFQEKKLEFMLFIMEKILIGSFNSCYIDI